MPRFNRLCDIEADEELGKIFKERQKTDWDSYFGDLDKSIQGYKKVLSFYQRVNAPQNVDWILINLAYDLINNENYEEAIFYLEQFLSIRESGGGIITFLGARAALAVCLALLGKGKEARQQLERAKGELQGSYVFVDDVLLKIYEAQLLSLEEYWDDSFMLFDTVHKVLDNGKWVSWQADNLRGWGIAHLRRGKEEDKVRAKELLEQALDMYEKMEAWGWVKRVQDLLAETEITS